MAIENVAAFLEALSKDVALQNTLKEKELAYTGAKDDREAIIREVLLPVAEAAGYTFTAEELMAFEQSRQTSRELSEDELEAVSGGLT